MRLPLVAGPYVVDRTTNGYSVVDTSGAVERVVDRFEFRDEETRLAALHASFRSAIFLNEERANGQRRREAQVAR